MHSATTCHLNWSLSIDASLTVVPWSVLGDRLLRRVFLTVDASTASSALKWAEHAGDLVGSASHDVASGPSVEAKWEEWKTQFVGKNVLTIAGIDTNHVVTVGVVHVDDIQVTPSLRGDAPKFDEVHLLSQVRMRNRFDGDSEQQVSSEARSRRRRSVRCQRDASKWAESVFKLR